MRVRLLKRRVRRFHRFERKQCRKAWYALQKQRVARAWQWLRCGEKKPHKKLTAAPLLEWAMRLGFVLRTSNNARAVLWLSVNTLWFCANVAILVASFIFAPDAITGPEERMYNFIRHGTRATDLEMASTFTRALVSLWASVLSAQIWSWLLWVVSALSSVAYLVVALREEFAEAIESAREMVSQRTITDLPDQQPTTGQQGTPAAPARAGGVVGFLRNRARFAAEDLTWEMIQEGIQRGWRALRGG